MEASAEHPRNLSSDIERYVRERVDVAVGDVVPEIVSREEDRRFRQFKWIAALVGLVGLGTFGTLSNYLIEKAVEAKLEARTGNISDSLEFIRFNSIALKLDLGTSFSKDDRAAVTSYLRKAAKNDRIRFTTEFLASLTQVVKSFTAANLDSSIDEIVQLYERELLTSDTTVEILIHHYGQKIVVRPGESRDDFALKTYLRLESIAGGAKVPELALVYRMLQTHRVSEESPSKQVRELLKQAAMLSDEDLQRFFSEILQRTVVENWQSRPSIDGRMLERISRTFFSTYADDLATMTQLQRDSFKKIGDSGVSEERVIEIAAMLAEAVKATGKRGT